MSQKTDGVLKLGLVFFVTLLSFSIGTYVGKKYSDNQHKLSLLEPKKDHSTNKGHGAEEFAAEHEGQSEKTAEHNEHGTKTTESSPAALTDAEVAKIAEEFAIEDDGDTSNEKTVGTIETPEKDVKTVAENTGHEAPKAVAPKTAGTTKPSAKPVVKQTPKAAPVAKAATAHTPDAATHQTETTPIAASAPTKTEENRNPASTPARKEVVPVLYTVQIGSYSSQAEAEKITTDLQSKGFKTSFVPATVNGQTWYRVNVGLFGTVKEAQEYKKEFLTKTPVTSAIVQRVQQ